MTPRQFSNKIETKKKLYIFSVMVFLYVVLFEFVLTPVKFIPKPTILYDSFISIWGIYNLVEALFTTTTIIYLALLIGYMLIAVLANQIIKILLEYTGVINISIPFKFLSSFFFAILFNLWFQESVVAEFVFALLIVMGILISEMNNSLNNSSDEFVLSARSLGLGKNDIFKKVIWKEIQPNIFNSLIKAHIWLWIIVLVYEFVGGVEGLGSVYHIAFTYNDIAGVIALGLLSSSLILIGNWIISYLQTKIIFWE